MRRTLCLVAAAALLVFTACEGETEPADTSSYAGNGSVLLKAKVRCTGVERGTYWFEVRGPTGGFAVVDPLNPTPYNCGQASPFVTVTKEARGFNPGSRYEFRICGDGTSPDSPRLCVDQDGTAHEPGVSRSDIVYDSFTIPADPPPPPPSLIPANAVPVAAGTQEWNGTPGSTFTTSQCPHAIPYMQEGDTIFARFQRNPGEPQSAGGYRCEQQSSTYIEKGEYWFQWRARYPNGYEPNCASWCTMRQWHENTSDGGGPVYLATFFQNGRPQIDGQFVSPGTQSLDVDVREWHVYTARINFQSNNTGFAELWIDGQFSGRTTNNVTATPSNSYDKYGTYGGDSNTTRTADYDYARAWRIPNPNPPSEPPAALWQDDFERSDILGNKWRSVEQRTTDHMAQTSTVRARDGARSARFELRDGDIANSSSDERQQLSDALNPDGTSFRPKEGDDLYSALSLYFEPGFPVRSSCCTWQVFQSFTSFDARGSGPLKIGHGGADGNLAVEGVDPSDPAVGAGYYWMNDTATATAGWHDLVLHTKFSQNASVGFIEFWHREPGEAGYTKQTLTDGSTKRFFSTLLEPSAFLKLGLYRAGAFTGTGVMYADRFKIGTTFDSVALP